MRYLLLLLLFIFGCGTLCHYKGRQYREWECANINIMAGSCYNKMCLETYFDGNVYEYQCHYGSL